MTIRRLGLAALMAIATLVLLAAGYASSGGAASHANTPEAAVRSLYDHVRTRDFPGAFRYVAVASNTDVERFTRDVAGRDGSLRTLSTLQDVNTSVLHENDTEAAVRANTHWSSAVGSLYDSRELRVVRENEDWKVVWPSDKTPNVPPQVLALNFLRWEIIHPAAGEDWGAQNAEAPRVRILNMTPLQHDLGNGLQGVMILGEIVNEDTVPGFVSVTATLLGANGESLGQETAFDKISHTLLPREVSPFRIDFPGAKLADIRKVTMEPTALLVPASADPVIGVLHQRIETDARGHKILKGELVNQSGETVNIPHVIATFYNEAGKVIWVSDGYVDHALQPQIPEPFQLEVRDDMGATPRFRVTVNQYTIERQGA
ncbi:MAG: hypothetical protein JO041_14370 [Acidobacteria bacterium]|nr:hypothetical protein [Acidobacteriota bacterium]